jgi:peroxiredoxin
MMVDRISEEDGVLPTYAFLSDAGHRVIDRYGLFNQDDPKGRAITHPATFIIDKSGIVRYRFVEVDYKVRPTNDDLLVELAALGH